MRICQFKSEKGMTLVELLAALALFGLIVALSSGVIVQLMGSEQKTSASISVKQEANVVMSDLRSQFYTKDTNKICLPPDTPLKVAEAQIINGVEKQMDSDGCVNDVDQQEPIEMNLTFSDTASKQEIELQTSWAGRKEHVLLLSSIDNCKDNDNNGCEDDNEEDDSDDFEKFPCIINGSISTNKKVKLMKGRCPEDTYIITGALTANNSFSLQHDGVILKIGGSATFHQEVEIAKNTQLIVGGAAQFNQRIKLKKESLIDIKGSATFQEINLHKGAKIIVNNKPYEP
ncbi:prepilin-type N-terminal cleavage/methylation domain-containing protein [Virgibacillus halodenitrificans]|uniref:Prepilin-type N-terminal cleavage/methylation domain-containing protein n=1 Tax=Virgibacillus halodenitrificans TaxID=1482 RepID=A0ABR7VSK0_VIRHA|nr:prepilin-type N-terminal cleavage/methylation domain-containing protein [Virgibacillus halodenitrificans]MBD1223923.1 prepilin-type N-terminal cleavage/methylation domain-containing protein [Virgibacillus halodenitrificans]